MKINQDRYGSVPKPLGEIPDVYITEVTSEETGHIQKIVSMKFVKSEKMTRCVIVGCDENDWPIENHVTYKFPWDIERVAAEFDGGGKVSFKYVMTPRYGRQWSYFGTYLIGQTVGLDPSVARTPHPFLLGRTINEELDDHIRILEVDKSRYPTIHEAFTSSEEPTNESLATMLMEQEIARVVGEWRAGICVFPTTSNEPSIVAEMEHNLAQYLAERKEKACAFCEEQPCAWLSNHKSMHTWDKLEHGNLPEGDVPTANIRRKKLYHQMAIMMNGGLMGKGFVSSIQNA
jgi:hypothetical protein